MIRSSKKCLVLFVSFCALVSTTIASGDLKAQLVDTNWTCPGSTCPSSFRWDWVETTVQVFEDDYFTDEEHCHSR